MSKVLRRNEGMNNMLELKQVSFDVAADGQEKEIIRQVDLTVPKGKFVVVTGPNGGGKSTLAKLIAGIEKPTGGKIFLKARISPKRASPNAPDAASALPFSSPCVSRASACSI